MYNLFLIHPLNLVDILAFNQVESLLTNLLVNLRCGLLHNHPRILPSSLHNNHLGHRLQDQQNSQGINHLDSQVESRLFNRVVFHPFYQLDNPPLNLVGNLAGNHPDNQLNSQVRIQLDNLPDNQPRSRISAQVESPHSNPLLSRAKPHPSNHPASLPVNPASSLPFVLHISPPDNQQGIHLCNRPVFHPRNQHYVHQGNPQYNLARNPLANPLGSHLDDPLVSHHDGLHSNRQCSPAKGHLINLLDIHPFVHRINPALSLLSNPPRIPRDLRRVSPSCIQRADRLCSQQCFLHNSLLRNRRSNLPDSHSILLPSSQRSNRRKYQLSNLSATPLIFHRINLHDTLAHNHFFDHLGNLVPNLLSVHQNSLRQDLPNNRPFSL